MLSSLINIIYLCGTETVKSFKCSNNIIGYKIPTNKNLANRLHLLCEVSSFEKSPINQKGWFHAIHLATMKMKLLIWRNRVSSIASELKRYCNDNCSLSQGTEMFSDTRNCLRGYLILMTPKSSTTGTPNTLYRVVMSL